MPNAGVIARSGLIPILARERRCNSRAGGDVTDCDGLARRVGSRWPDSGRRKAAGARARGIGCDTQGRPSYSLEAITSMSTCPACASPVTDAQRFCPACGASLDVADSPDRHRAPSAGPEVGLAVAPQSHRHPPVAPRARDGRRPSRGALRARHGARRALPHRRPPRPRRDGGGVPRRRPEARAARGPQVPAARAGGRLPSASSASTARCAWRARSRTRRSAACGTSARPRGSTSCRWSSWTGRTSRRSSAASGASRRTRPWTSRGRWRRGSPPRTRRACCTAT